MEQQNAPSFRFSDQPDAKGDDEARSPTLPILEFEIAERNVVQRLLFET
jgi:hypothetical protein